jgi:hypothetical protein
VALSDDEQALLARLRRDAPHDPHNQTADAYYDGEQRVEQLGLAFRRSCGSS